MQAEVAVGTHKQLLLDDRLIVRSEGVRRVMNPARSTGERLIQPDAPPERVNAAAQTPTAMRIGAYSSVMHDQGKIRLWWFANVPHDEQEKRRRICYAESHDGLHFHKPELGLFEMLGDKANGAVIGDYVQGACVWVDPHAPPERRYRTQAKFGPFPGKPQTLWFFASPDGLRWEKTHEVAIGECDTQNVIFWDEAYGRYVMYSRHWERFDDANLNHRKVRRIESDDLVTWDNERIVWEADAVDLARHTTSTGKPPVDYYGACVYKYPEAANLYIMLAQPFWHWKDRPPEEQWGYSPDPKTMTKKVIHLGPSTMDVRLAYSVDGVRFEHAVDRGPFMALGPEGRFDSRRVWALPHPIVMGDEIWIYYTGTNVDHDKFVDPAAPGQFSDIGRAVMRLDGFVSADTDHHGGWFETPPLRFEGDRLQLNLDTGGGGCVRVEVADERGQAIAGFSKDDAAPTVGNSVRMPATWRSQRTLGELSNQPIKLRFHMAETKLYSFRFQ